jgi:ribosomal-protein-alanine N-acetyltransferase
VILETPRLVLRELDLEDLDFVAAMLAHREVMQFFPKCYTREESGEWILRQRERYRKDGYGYWLAVDKRSGEPVGQAGVMQAEVEGVASPSLGYIMHRPYWRRGFASEAAAAARDWVFETLDRRRVITLIRPENLPSLGVARKIGMQIERRTIFGGYEHFVLSALRPACEAPDSIRIP